MVRRILSAMNKEIRGLHEAAYLIALFTLFSQILAILRDRSLAHVLGADLLLDAYFAAFKIPDLAFALLTLFVSSFALLPLLEKAGGAGTSRGRELLGSVVATFGVVSIVLSLAVFAFLPFLVPLLFPGFTPELRELVIFMSQVMLLQPLLLGLSSIVSSIVQSSRRFFLFALAPIFYNTGIIFGVLFLYKPFGIWGLAAGVVIGALLHLLVQTVPLLFTPASIVLTFTKHWLTDIRQVVILSFPRTAALSAHQVLLVAFAGIASLSSIGSVAVTNLAWNLQSVPLSIVAVSYASALFPSLSSLWARGEKETFTREAWATVRHITLWITLAIALIIVLRAHLVRVILGSGAFTWADTRLTAAVLGVFALSLIAQAAILIFSRGYYAAGRQVEPLIINVGGCLAASVLALFSFRLLVDSNVSRYFLEDLFRVSGISGTEIIALPLSYSLVMLGAALVFGVLFAHRFGFEKGTIKSILFSVVAAVAAGSGAYATLRLFGPLLPTETFVGIFAQGAAGGVVGILTWAVVLLLLRSREFLEAVAVLRKLVQR